MCDLENVVISIDWAAQYGTVYNSAIENRACQKSAMQIRFDTMVFSTIQYGWEALKIQRGALHCSAVLLRRLQYSIVHTG